MQDVVSCRSLWRIKRKPLFNNGYLLVDDDDDNDEDEVRIRVDVFELQTFGR